MNRILTTHVGSLPRPEDLIRTMFAKQEGVPVDPVALERRTSRAVAEVVAKQIEAGVDVVSDGEMGKPSYVTYITDRLDGFGGTSHPLTYSDLVDFPVERLDAEHRAILAACVARDAHAAAAATRKHLENTVEHVAARL